MSETATIQTFSFGPVGKKQVLDIQRDQHGRIVLRVNGRIAAQPMMPDEEEREVTIGESLYRVSRMEGDSWHIERLVELHVDHVENDPFRSSTRRFVWAVVGVALLVVVASIASFYQFHQTNKIEWKKFAAPDGTFTASIPAPLVELNGTIEFFGKEVPLNIWTTELNGKTYEVWSLNISSIPRRTSDGMAETAAHAITKRIGGTILDERYLEVDMHHGHLFAVRLPPGAKYPNGAIVRGKGGTSGDHVTLAVTYSQDTYGPPAPIEIRRFLDDFHLPQIFTH